jgi:hypothetical protein
VRFQPNSIEDAYLSAVTLADFAQLTPNRTATMTSSSGDRRRVTVSLAVSDGTYSNNNVAEKENTPAGAKLPPLPPEVEVLVEERRDDFAAGIAPTRQGWGNELAWRAVQAAKLLTPQKDSQGRTVGWSGDVILPSDNCRVVFKEYEVFAKDAGDDIGAPSGSDGTYRRLVYADALSWPQ